MSRAAPHSAPPPPSDVPLPAANDLLVMPKQTLAGTAPLLSGVLALPPQASPTPSNQPFGAGLTPVTQQDTAIYGVFAVKVAASTTIVEFARSLLSGTIGPSVVTDQKVSAGGLQGLLAYLDLGGGH